MEKLNSLDVPLPGHGQADFMQPIAIGTIHSASLYFTWRQPTVGFGECSIGYADGRLVAATEGMGKEWLRRALYAAVDVLVEQVKIE